METMKMIFVVLLLGRAIDTDIRKDKIENRCVLFGTVTGLACAWWSGGMEVLLESVKMAGVMILILFCFFLVKGLGAGDIKLFGVLALFFPTDIIRIVMASFVVAAGTAIVKMIIRFLKKTQVYIQGEKMKFAVSIGCGTMIVMIPQWMENV